VEAAVFDEHLLGCFLEATASGCEVARVKVEEVGAVHALGLLVPEVVLVAAFLHEVEPAGATDHQLTEALVVDRVQLRRGAWLYSGGRFADPEMSDRHAQVLDALHAIRPGMSAAVAVVALAHELGKLRALPHKVAERVVCDFRSRVARHEVLRVEPHGEDLLFECEDASAGAEAPELERLATATRQVAPAVTDAHEIGEFLRGNVVHLGMRVTSAHRTDQIYFFCM